MLLRMWDLSSLARNWTPALEVQSLNHWTVREVPEILSFNVFKFVSLFCSVNGSFCLILENLYTPKVIKNFFCIVSPKFYGSNMYVVWGSNSISFFFSIMDKQLSQQDLCNSASFSQWSVEPSLSYIVCINTPGYSYLSILMHWSVYALLKLLKIFNKSHSFSRVSCGSSLIT